MQQQEKSWTDQGMDIESFLKGDKLYGEDFGTAELHRWYSEEEEGYAGIEDTDLADGGYSYGALNWWYFWRYIRGRQRRFPHCVSLGGARGDDVAPLADLVDHYTIIEPSRSFWTDEIGGKPAKYLSPEISGEIPMKTASADLVTSLGTLHHIANVSYVVSEVGRILAPGGYFVLREPVHSMGDWREPREGKTRNERGIPVKLLKSWLLAANLEPVKIRYCIFAPLERMRRTKIGRNLWNTRWMMPVDQFLSRLFSWNQTYLRRTFFQKIAPGCVCVIARRKA